MYINLPVYIALLSTKSCSCMQLCTKYNVHQSSCLYCTAVNKVMYMYACMYMYAVMYKVQCTSIFLFILRCCQQSHVHVCSYVQSTMYINLPVYIALLSTKSCTCMHACTCMQLCTKYNVHVHQSSCLYCAAVNKVMYMYACMYIKWSYRLSP